jgi:acetyl/propionyl-CoA carboxylase alpha subunit
MGTPEVPLENAHETIEHHAHAASEPWVMGVALTAAILAALAAVTALYAEHFATEAMHELIESSDKWNESQADSIKEKELDIKKILLNSLKKELDPDEEKKLQDYAIKKEENRSEAIMKKERSNAHVRKQLPLSVGLTMFQVAIAIGAISVLTRRREFWFVCLAFGVVGVGFLMWGLAA